MKLNKIHHVAVICSDYEQSKQFYTEVLGVSGNLVGISINLCKSIQKELFINDTP